MIFIVGITHDLQRPGNPFADDFKASLRTIISSIHPSCIAEEWSERGSGGVRTTVTELMEEMGLSHVHKQIDPNEEERITHNIIQTPAGRGKLDFKSRSDWMRYLRGYHRREHIWIRKLEPLNNDILLIIGESHVVTLPPKLRRKGIDFQLKPLHFRGEDAS